MADDQRATLPFAAPQDRAGPPGVSIATVGAVGVLTLELPGDARRLTSAMQAQIAAAFLRFARDPNTYGVVIRSAAPGSFLCDSIVDDLARLSSQTSEGLRTELSARHALVWQLECFSKPTLAFIDGSVTGAGIGLTLNATHRIAGPNYGFSLPETLAGSFPGYGSAFHLARMPDDIGLYLALTGRQIGPADALALGLVTQYADADALSGIVAGVADAMPVDPLLARVHRDAGAIPLEPHRGVIRRCFAGHSVEDIVQRLTSEVSRASSGSAFAAGVLADLARCSAFALKVTFRHIREAVALDLRQVLIRDYRLTLASIEGRDLRGAVAGRVTGTDDTDDMWGGNPADLADVSDARVGSLFEPRHGHELVLPIRREMQAARV